MEGGGKGKRKERGGGEVGEGGRDEGRKDGRKGGKGKASSVPSMEAIGMGKASQPEVVSYMTS